MELHLPDHIVKVSDKWFKNNKTGKFIHVDKIESFLETYWQYRSKVIEASYTKQKFNKNIKDAKHRWGL